MRILVFDSGVGGLSVAREIMRQMPGAGIDFLADSAVFPYGELTDEALVARVVDLVGDALSRSDPAAVVIACNTASTLVLPPLRARFSLPVVGTVPAIKPAAEVSRTRYVSVLATPGTVKRDYTRDLIARYGQDCSFTLCGSHTLAGFAERILAGEAVDDDAIAGEIAPCFVTGEDGRRTDCVVLACTHYPLIRDRLERLAPWPVMWIDPAPAIARRVRQVAGEAAAGVEAPVHVFRATGRRPPAETLKAFGFI